MTLIGMLLMTTKFFWYRRERKVVISGSTSLIGNSEEFKKWGVRYFDQWKSELSGIANVS